MVGRGRSPPRFQLLHPEMRVTLITGSNGLLGRNAGEASNAYLMRKPEALRSERHRQCNPTGSAALFTIEHSVSVVPVTLDR